MSVVDKLHVDWSDAIQHEPDLFEATKLATHYLSSQLESHAHVFGDNRFVSWQYQKDHIDGPRVAVGYTEEDELGSRIITRWIKPNEVLDPVMRDVHMLYLLQDILKQRWKQIDSASRDRLLTVESKEEYGDTNTVGN